MNNKKIIDGLRKGEKECVKPRAGDANLWITFVKHYMNCQKEVSWWKWSMSRHTARRKKKKNDAV